MRSRVVAGGLAAIIALASSGLAWMRARDQVTPVAVSEAVSRFRAGVAVVAVADQATIAAPTQATLAPSTPALTAPASAIPAPQAATPVPPQATRGPASGVYVYATRGFEEISALGGARHDYPAETAITVKATSCGVSTEWAPMQEHWERSERCDGTAGELLRTITVHHEFYGMGDERQQDCDAGSLYRPANAAPGTSFTFRCVAPTAVWSAKGTVVGIESVDVAGVPVQTVHLRLETRNDGDTVGTGQDDLWIVPSSGLLVKSVDAKDMETVSHGIHSTYTERVELVLRSLTPAT